MTAYSWKTAVSGAWTNAGLWTPAGGPPDSATDDAVIGAAGAYTVTLATGSAETIDALTLSDPGATLDVAGRLAGGTIAVTAGTLDLAGTIAGATLSDAGGVIAYDGGTLDAVTYRGTLGVASVGGILTLAGGITLTGADGTGPGTILLGEYEDFDTLLVAGTTTLDNVTITFGVQTYVTLSSVDPSGAGVVLTLGSTTIVQDNNNSYVTLSDGGKAGDELINRGTIVSDNDNSYLMIAGRHFDNVGSIELLGGNGEIHINSATFSNEGVMSAVDETDARVVVGSFSNSGSIIVQDRADFLVQTTTFTNIVGTALTGGTYALGYDAELEIVCNGVIATLDANFTLEQISSVFVNGDSIESMLTSVAAGGTLSLLGGRGFAAAGQTLTVDGLLSFSNTSSDPNDYPGFVGTIALGALHVGAGGRVLGNGVIAAPLLDAGTVAATGGLLTLRGAVTGTGTLLIDNAATLEPAAATAHAVTFAAGAVGTLLLDDPAGFTGAIDGLALGDAIDFASETVTSAVLTGSTLTVVGSAGTVHFQVAGALAGNYFAIANDRHTIVLSSAGPAPTIYTWNSAVSGDWSDASRWSPAGGPPDSATADAVIGVAGTYTVALVAGSTETIDTLTLSNAAATLDLAGTLSAPTASSGGTIALDAGVLDFDGGKLAGCAVVAAGGSLAFTGRLEVVSSGYMATAELLGGVLDDSAWRGVLDIEGTQNASGLYSGLFIVGGIHLTGASGTGPGAVTLGNNGELDMVESGTIDDATITMAATTGHSAILTDSGVTDATLTLGSDLLLQVAALGGTADLGDTIAGYHKTLDNNGTILVGGGRLDIGFGALVNDGAISVGAGGVLKITELADNEPGTFDSGSGTITATDAALTLDITAYSALTIGTTVVNGGTLNLDIAESIGDDVFPITAGSISATDAVVVIQYLDWSATYSLTLVHDVVDVAGIFVLSAPLDLHTDTVKVKGGELDVAGTLTVGPGTEFGTVTLDNGGIFGGGTILDAASGIILAGTADSLGIVYGGVLNVTSGNLQLSLDTGFGLVGASGTGPGALNIGAGNLVIVNTGSLDNATITIAASSDGSLDARGLVAPDGDGGFILGTKLVLQDGPGDSGGISYLNGGDSVRSYPQNLVNYGTVLADTAGGHLEILGFSFTNGGLIEASNGDTLSVETRFVTNLGGGVVIGGSYSVGAGSLLQLVDQVPIDVLRANVTLSGAGSVFETTSGVVVTTLESSLTTIATAATLSVLGGRGYTTTNAITEHGNLVLQGGTFASGAITIGQAGTLLGYGVVSAVVANSGVIDANGGTLALTGGEHGFGALRADAGSVLRIDATPLTTVANRISLIGAGSSIQFGTVTLETSLTSIAAGATFSVLGGRGYVSGNMLTDSGVFNLGGGVITLGGLTVTAGGVVSGSGTISHAVASAGTIDARAGLLKLGAVTGVGSLKIENASTLELTAASQAVTFAAGGVATLALDAPAGFSGHIGGLALGDKIDFTSETVTSATVAGTTLTVVGSAGTNTYQVAGALAGNHFAIQADHHTIALIGGAALALAPPSFLPLSAAADAPALAVASSADTVPSLNIAGGTSYSPDPTPTAGAGWLYHPQPPAMLLVGHH